MVRLPNVDIRPTGPKLNSLSKDNKEAANLRRFPSGQGMTETKEKKTLSS